MHMPLASTSTQSQYDLLVDMPNACRDKPPTSTPLLCHYGT